MILVLSEIIISHFGALFSILSICFICWEILKRYAPCDFVKTEEGRFAPGDKNHPHWIDRGES